MPTAMIAAAMLEIRWLGAADLSNRVSTLAVDAVNWGIRLRWAAALHEIARDPDMATHSNLGLMIAAIACCCSENTDPVLNDAWMKRKDEQTRDGPDGWGKSKHRMRPSKGYKQQLYHL